MTVILAVALLFSVWSAPASYEKAPWPWLSWALCVGVLCFAILVTERGWP